MPQTIPSTMRAAAIDQFGGDITLHTLPVPKPDAGEVLIRVEAAGVGVWDEYERTGGFAKMLNRQQTFPHVLGSDGAGTVLAVGGNVKQFKDGDRVYGMALMNPKGGFQAEYVAVDANLVAKMGGKLGFEQAGVLAVDAITALSGLDDTLKLKSGESVLIFGASGGIGHLAVQLARGMGARVFAVASGDDGVDLAKRLGADAVVNGRKADVVAEAKTFAPGGVDAALITAGGEAANRALEAVRDGGRVAFPSGVEPEPKPRSGVTAKRYDGMPSPDRFEKLNRLIDAGPFEVAVAKTFSLEQAAEAQQALKQHFLGKLAILPKVAGVS